MSPGAHYLLRYRYWRDQCRAYGAPQSLVRLCELELRHHAQLIIAAGSLSPGRWG